MQLDNLLLLRNNGMLQWHRLELVADTTVLLPNIVSVNVFMYCNYYCTVSTENTSTLHQIFVLSTSSI